jgi:hypothetical protein
MTDEVKKIKDVFDRQKTHRANSESTKEFLKEFEKDVTETLQEKYPWADFVPNRAYTDLEAAKSKMLEERRLKGYAFDSLVYRYRIAREAQARADAENDLRSGRTDQRADAYRRRQEQADRDLMAFIKVLDDVIGEHD